MLVHWLFWDQQNWVPGSRLFISTTSLRVRLFDFLEHRAHDINQWQICNRRTQFLYVYETDSTGDLISSQLGTIHAILQRKYWSLKKGPLGIHFFYQLWHQKWDTCRHFLRFFLWQVLLSKESLSSKFRGNRNKSKNYFFCSCPLLMRHIECSFPGEDSGD